MKNTARALTPLAVFFFAACQSPAPPAASSPATPPAPLLAPSPHRLVGRVIGVDSTRRFAIVELAPSAPVSRPDTELIARTDDLRETARLRATRQLRGRTLGTAIMTGQPAIGDEVVWASP